MREREAAEARSVRGHGGGGGERLAREERQLGAFRLEEGDGVAALSHR